jgi:hypothetical protein
LLVRFLYEHNSKGNRFHPNFYSGQETMLYGRAKVNGGMQSCNRSMLSTAQLTSDS